MKSLLIVALLLIWQRNIANGQTSDFSDDTGISPRLLLSPCNITDNPVDMARQLLIDLELFNLVGEVIQATVIEKSSSLIFEMGDALQAKEVATAGSTMDIKPIQTLDNLFSDYPNIDLRNL